MITIKCPVCSVGYDNYEDKSFIAGHNMCIDCYEDRNTPNMPKGCNCNKGEIQGARGGCGICSPIFIK